MNETKKAKKIKVKKENAAGIKNQEINENGEPVIKMDFQNSVYGVVNMIWGILKTLLIGNVVYYGLMYIANR